MNRANQLFRKLKRPKVTQEERDAWNVITRFLNKHPELSFHISPWTDDHDENCYTLRAFNGDKEETLLTAATPWKSENKGGH